MLQTNLRANTRHSTGRIEQAKEQRSFTRSSLRQLVSYLSLTTLAVACISNVSHAQSQISACISSAKSGLLAVPEDRSERFLGKVQEDTALCRGGEEATRWQDTPWVDWQNYFAAADETSLSADGKKARTKIGEHLYPDGRGVDGALMDLEFQRIELIKFNLFDQSTFEEYVKGRDGIDGKTLDQWDAMRLPSDHPQYEAVGGEQAQLCTGDLLTHRNLTGICNDAINPLMGSSAMPFARNAQFEATFPDLQLNDLASNRHNGRIDLLTPDPQLISRKLFTRAQEDNNGCNQGQGDPDYSTESSCDYLKAPFFNVLAAFWIQFMTHDWFSHSIEGHNEKSLESVGCSSQEAIDLGCRPDDRREPSLYADTDKPPSFTHGGESFLSRAPKTTDNQVSAWWDASQIYGHDELSASRVKRDPADSARLQLIEHYLPLLDTCDPRDTTCATRPQWSGQESVGFPDNWNIGLSFYHNVFAREHNAFVDHVRQLQSSSPDADSGLRSPDRPDEMITWKNLDNERLFQIARLVVSAQIAKIHTIEWTTQLLYNEPLHAAMNSNWYGLFNQKEDNVSKVLRRLVNRDESLLSRWAGKLSNVLGSSDNAAASNSLYSVFASGAGIFGLGNSKPSGLLWWKDDKWDITNIESDVNGGINHFGSPFNFPEEFTSVYRLHALVPDLIEYRSNDNPNEVTHHIPVLDTVRGDATQMMQQRGIDNWALSMGRQRLGVLHLNNLPAFLQNLPMPHLPSQSGKLDIAALDIIRDRERGIPRFNEFRRQIGLKTLTGFDDFIDKRLDPQDPWRQQQQETVDKLREIYGTHTCDASKIISTVQRDASGEFINDCHGNPDGSIVDNIEDVDNIVGWLAEYTRPHGFAISETQFHIFIINASRRLFSDRFFTSSFRPEFYSQAGFDWVQNNGPLDDCPFPLGTDADGDKICLEPVAVNGHDQEVSPMKRVLLRTLPGLTQELLPVRNIFDPWARDRGDYYSLEWTPRPGTEQDDSFTEIAEHSE